MAREMLAIANCRVSSSEQLLNNSLERQEISVFDAAKKLDAKIVKIWSGSVSSKAGTNVDRKDLNEMLDFCKKNKTVKYAIFDEYDRYMRSINEGSYFEVLFNTLGVKVWYASESDAFNGDDAMAKFMRSLSAFKAEGSNEERQRKSIAGQINAINQGRFPFAPKPGYKKGVQNSIQEIHEVRGPILKEALLMIASKKITPSDALIKFNKSSFMSEHSPYKMDKFRKIITDPFYAGILVMDKQVKARNEHGLHEPLITKNQHYVLVDIMSNKKKVQSGPRKGGNSAFPLNNIVSCGLCLDKPNGRVVGFNHGNGKPNSKVWAKYRCRSCSRYITREKLHTKLQECLAIYAIKPKTIDFMIEELDKMWHQSNKQIDQDLGRIRGRIKFLEKAITEQVESATDPENASIKQEILKAIQVKKDELADQQDQLSRLGRRSEHDEETFIRFTLSMFDNMHLNFLVMDQETRLRCKQVLFPSGFIWTEDGNVYTPKISSIYSLLPIKTDSLESAKSLLVRVRGL